MRLLARHLAFRLVVTVMGTATAVLLVAALAIGLVSIKRTEQIVADDLTRQQLIVARSSAIPCTTSAASSRRWPTRHRFSTSRTWPGQTGCASAWRS
jgi:hypothetical protein